MKSIGVPVKLLHESEGFIVSIEVTSGEIYRGLMVEATDNWNCQLQNVTMTSKSGKVSRLEHVFIRGSTVRFIILPDMLKNAPLFAKFDSKLKAAAPIAAQPMMGRGSGRGMRR